MTLLLSVIMLGLYTHGAIKTQIFMCGKHLISDRDISSDAEIVPKIKYSVKRLEWMPIHKYALSQSLLKMNFLSYE